MTDSKNPQPEASAATEAAPQQAAQAEAALRAYHGVAALACAEDASAAAAYYGAHGLGQHL